MIFVSATMLVVCGCANLQIDAQASFVREFYSASSSSGISTSGEHGHSNLFWLLSYLVVNTDPPNIITIPGTGGYCKGAVVTLTAPELVPINSSISYRFGHWDVDGASQGVLDSIMVIMNINHTATAHYALQYSELTLPWISVNPNTFLFHSLTDVLNLNVLLNNVSKESKLVGTQFTIAYDNTLLNTTVGNVTEGDFMNSFATRAGTSTFFQAYIDPDNGLIGIMILPINNGTWSVNAFPEGTGLLSTIKFTAATQDLLTDLTTTLRISDPLLVDNGADQIPIDQSLTAAQGICNVTIQAGSQLFLGEIDVYTQYPSPYGGQGKNNPSDAFPPQGTIHLYANVTYHGEPVPTKPVTFQVEGLQKEISVATNFTDDSGIAQLTLNVPAMSPDSNGTVWMADASVDVAGRLLRDSTSFFVGWLIKIQAFTINPADTEVVNGLQHLHKQQSYDMNLSLSVYSMQDLKGCLQMKDTTPNTVVTYSGRDEVGQPLFEGDIETTIGSVPYGTLQPGQSRPYFDGLVTGIYVPQYAFTGTATIQANVLTDFPANNCVAIAPPFDQNAWIEMVS